MDEMQRTADLIAHVSAGAPWHAESIDALLDSVSSSQASAHPVAGSHSIWEIVLHMTGWIEECLARLGGAAASIPASGDWPRPSTGDSAWAGAQADLLAALDRLSGAARAMDAEALDQQVVDRRDSSGHGASKHATLHGALHHTVYHAGQIALLKRALRS